MGTSQVSETRPKANSIKPAGLEEVPTPATNRSTTVHSRITKKHNILTQVIMHFSLRYLKNCTSFTRRLGIGKSKLHNQPRRVKHQLIVTLT
ncbi:unnamed protein product [Tetraodon nigroviridis]|uniref:(spotted green pufferfish) hypothetical protein n=1 Tax=Tetraodon nigroviridis TaxID=99883 RepID=Q4RJF2_TETNG|nr:unnamed protein product [Tetraodon nigroviridis]